MSAARHALVLLVLLELGIFGVGGALLAFGPWPRWWAMVPSLAGGATGLALMVGFAVLARRKGW